ncbi:uncharacterized protein LOC131641334 [Vicia villosa]|uniref:uncharacterized protein LOC131641334 n=1 Tax=Vicia villosa TaxID=3911 RepID=UPI00273CCD1D|nr:uncharacterized protein LOC131641334 [Vicia villosa]
MSRAPIFIKNLLKGNQVWKMHIRVVDMWIVIEKNGSQHLEAVIQDAKGDKIHVTTWGKDFQDWVEVVTEHGTYYLYNGEPVENDGPFKVCFNPLKLIFNGGTTMTKVAIPEIPTHSYSFHPIENFLKGDFKHDHLYDVIGVLQDVLKTQTGGGGRKSCVNVTISDVNGNVIELVLWEDYGKQFINYTTPNNFAGPTIIVLTHAWCKPNTLFVSGLPCLSNAWNGSKLYINLEHPQVDEFKASFGSNLPAPSQSLTADSSVQSANNFWTKLSEVKSIRAVSEFGRVFGWYFESTGNTDAERVTKFKLEVEVEYDNHKGIFVFWDKDCIPFTKLTAHELREIMKKAGEDNPKIWPTHLDVLLNRQMVFRIKYQSQFRRFSVVKILNEDGLYKRFDNYLTPNEGANAAVMEVDTTSPTLNPNQTFRDIDISLLQQLNLGVDRNQPSDVIRPVRWKILEADRIESVCGAPATSIPGRGRPKNHYGIPNMARNLTRKFPIPAADGNATENFNPNVIIEVPALADQQPCHLNHVSYSRTKPRCATVPKPSRGRPRKQLPDPIMPLGLNRELNIHTMSLAQSTATVTPLARNVFTTSAPAVEIGMERNQAVNNKVPSVS